MYHVMASINISVQICESTAFSLDNKQLSSHNYGINDKHLKNNCQN